MQKSWGRSRHLGRLRACQMCKTVRRCTCLMSVVECLWSYNVYAWWFKKTVCCKRFLVWKGGLSFQKTTQYQLVDCKQELVQSRSCQALGTWQACIWSSTTILWDLKVYKQLTHITWHNPGHSFEDTAYWSYLPTDESNDLKPRTSRHDIKSSIMIKCLEASAFITNFMVDRNQTLDLRSSPRMDLQSVQTDLAGKRHVQFIDLARPSSSRGHNDIGLDLKPCQYMSIVQKCINRIGACHKIKSFVWHHYPAGHQVFCLQMQHVHVLCMYSLNA